MRPLPIRPAPAGSTPTALRGKSALRATLATAVAAAIGFAPAIVFASPAAAAPGQYTIANISVAEGGDLVFEVTRPGGVAPEQEVTYRTVAGSATPGADYTADTDTLIFPENEGNTAQVLQVTIETNNDALDEADESLLLQVVDEDNATVTTGRGTIVDNDATPTYSLSALGATDESDDEEITATLSAASGRDVEIPVSTTDGTAKVGQDFTALDASAKITIPAGETTGSIDISILDDELDEVDAQTFDVVGAASGARNVSGSDSVTVTINDDDAEPELSVLGAATVEGGTLSFPVTLSAASEQVVTVEYASTDDDTTVDDDYTPVTGSLTFQPGQTSKTVSVVTKIDADADDDLTETLLLTLSAPVNASIAVGFEEADGAILGEDALPTVTLDPATPATVSEPDGDTPSSVLTFTATLSAASPTTTSFTYSTGSAGTGVGFAMPGDDFTATSAPVVVTFGPNQTVKTFTVPIVGDTTDEADETFNVLLASPVGIDPGADIGTNVVTITDNDDLPEFTVAASKAMDEGDGPSNATFAITLSNASDEDVDFVVETADGTAEEADADTGSDDYDTPELIVTIPAGETTGTITIPVIGDEIFEADETLTFTVDTAGAEDDAAGPAAERTLTLSNDDLAPKLTITSGSGSEGDIVAVLGVVSGMAQADTELDLEFAGASVDGTDAAEAGDFTNPGTVTVTIPAGTEESILLLGQVTLKNDTIDEPFETIVVSGEPDVADAGVVVSGAIGITDDTNDLPPSVSIDDETIGEQDGSVDVGLELTLPAGTTATEQHITVQYATLNGAALAGSDYTAKSGTVTFNPGQLTRQINVPVLNDTIDEEQGEDFFVTLTSPSPTGVTITDNKGEVLIQDNDATVKPSITVVPSPRIGVGAVLVTGSVRPGSAVKLMTAPISGGELTVVAYAAANASGEYQFTRYLPVGTRVATFANGLQSDVVMVRLAQNPALRASSPREGAATVSVTANPKAANLPVKILRRNADKTWSTVATGTTNSSGAYSRTLTRLKSGSRITYRAYVGGDADAGILAGYSVIRVVGIR